MIYDTINSCNLLLSKQCVITYKDNHNSILEKNITLSFEECDFPHSLGLHYIEDRQFLLKGRPTQVFRRIAKQDNLKLQTISSDHYSKIKNRLYLISNIESILDNKSTLHDYIKPRWSNIDAEMVIQNFVEREKSFFFMVQRNEYFYVAKSIFQSDKYYVTPKNKKIIVNIKWITKKA